MHDIASKPDLLRPADTGTEMSQLRLISINQVPLALNSRLLMVPISFLLFLSLCACNLQGTITTTTATQANGLQNNSEIWCTGKHQIVIKKLNFTPLEIDIKVGDSVTWVNNDESTRTVTSWDRFQDENKVEYCDIGSIWDSGDIKSGQSFSHTFDHAGIFKYVSLPLYLYLDYGQTAVGVIRVSE